MCVRVEFIFAGHGLSVVLAARFSIYLSILFILVTIVYQPYT